MTTSSEILQNCFEHNDDTCGFFGMQVYGKNTGEPFIEIGIADYGDGLKTTLLRNRKNRKIKTDIDAIREAIRPGISEFVEPDRGNGMYHLLRMTSMYKGTVQIRSGHSTMRFRFDTNEEWEFSGGYMPGVQISLTLPI